MIRSERSNRRLTRRRTRRPITASLGVERPLLQTVTKAEAVYLETRARILTGALSPGLEVNQEALAANLGVSITPLREALRRLEMEGLVRLEAHRTVVIAPLTGRELDELYVIRMELDALAAGLAAAKAQRRQAFAHRAARAAEGGQGAGRAARTQSRLPSRDLRVLRERRAHRLSRPALGPDRSLPVHSGEAGALGGPASTQDHIDIADAVAARDAERAARLTRDHIARSRNSIADIMNARSAREPAP